MKVYSIIQSMRQRLRVPLAVLYLLLGLATAWHHHNARPDSGMALQVSTSSPALNHLDDADAFCALCSWQTLQQEPASVFPVAVLFLPLPESPFPLSLVAPAPGFSPAHLARGPPHA